MNNKEKPKDMVSRNEEPRSTFRVEKPEPNESAQLISEVSDEEKELAAVSEALEQRRQDLAEKRQKANDAIRNEKLDQRATALCDATDYRELARNTSDAVKAKEYLRMAKEADAIAAQLGVELNLNEPTASLAGEVKKGPLSTNKALWIIGVLFGFFLLLTKWVGASFSDNPMNATGQSMMMNAPLRALISFTLTFLTFLISVFFIRVAFPQFYRIWHNRIDSERSLDTLLNEAPAWSVLAFLLGLFYTFMQLFASFYQSLYA